LIWINVIGYLGRILTLGVAPHPWALGKADDQGAGIWRAL